jgi:2-polyprenyl-3-methyl-5-hydroxy-6-metoxy-1,4-benzoquinol methylase
MISLLIKIYSRISQFINFKHRSKLSKDQDSVAFQLLMSQNNIDVYNKMYSSPELLKHYLVESTFEFYEKTREKIISHLSHNFDSLACLDVGCGTGHLLAKLREAGFGGRMVGIDTAVSAKEQVYKHNLDIEFFPGLLGSMDLGGKFDLILCTEVLEHCDYPELVIEKMKHVLNPGGVIFITVPDGRKDTWEGHIHFWSPQSFKLFILKICPNANFDYYDNVNMAIIKI